MSETSTFSYDKPLTPVARRTLNLLMERYKDDKGQPLVLFDSNPESETRGYVALHIPQVIKPTFFTAETIKPYDDEVEQAE